jgi:hypothetical protein
VRSLWRREEVGLWGVVRRRVDWSTLSEAEALVLLLNLPVHGHDERSGMCGLEQGGLGLDRVGVRSLMAPGASC